MTFLAATNGEWKFLLKRLLNPVVGMHSYILLALLHNVERVKWRWALLNRLNIFLYAGKEVF
jgi:hypothetical protein